MVENHNTATIQDTFIRMDPHHPAVNEEGQFKTPALPVIGTAQKKLRTMEWLQLDVEDGNQFEPSPLSHQTHHHDLVEADFKELHQRALSTSTPFVARTSAITSLSSDSGIDTFSLSIQSTTSTSSSSCHSANDLCNLTHNHDGLSSDYEGNTFISSKCSDADSAFGDASLASHDLSQDSQTSDCFSLDLNPGSFHNEEPRKNGTASRTCTAEPCITFIRQSKPSGENGALTSTTKEHSGTPHTVSTFDSLSLPTPSWCSPLATPGITTKPTCTSTPKDNIQENLHKILKQFSPSEPDRLIGRKMGLEYVDIVSELHLRSVAPLQLVFRHLEPEDLCRSCVVNSKWRSAIHSDSWTLKRKKSFLRNQKLPCQKENNGSKGKKALRGLTSGASRLGAIQVVAEKSACPTEHIFPSNTVPSVPRHKLFWEEANKCKEGESIRKCPRCSSPARVHDIQERAWCSNDKCNFDFCIKCNLPFHGATDCSLSSPTKNAKKSKKDIIGSKGSKKKLRRL